MHIIGASGHSKVLIEILLINKTAISAIWDDNPTIKNFLGYPIAGSVNLLMTVINPMVIVAIGDNTIRKKVSEKINAQFGIAIHPSSIISQSATVLVGTAVMANVTVNADTIIGRHVILNTGSSIDHDCRIDDFVHISPKVGLAGNVEVGEGTHIGIGACVIQGIKIGKWVTIGAGSVIIRNVPDYAVVVGNPGRIIKYNKEN
jgi:sugar O-acyltransferase (sialic acid O-acetyltransferase NeuD family)